MTSITKNNVLAKAAAVVAGLALVLSGFVFAPQARAQTNAELQAQIAVLLAQIAVLQAQLSGGAGVTCSVQFSRNLGIGSTGTDVLALQRLLNASADTRLAVSGAGSPGLETMYYGPITANAVSRFQVKYRSEILTPLGLVNPTGYFGASSRAKANVLCAITPPVTPPADEDDDDDELRGGESSLENLQASDGIDDEVEESETAEIAEFEFDVEDGDIRIDRLDLTFDAASGNDEDEPWGTFDTIRILDADGDQLAEEDVSDEDEWLDDDEPYVFRFTNLDYIVREGDQGVLIVEVESQNGIDGISDDETWTIYIDTDGLRGVDGAGIQQYLGDDSETVTFDVVEEGTNDELDVRSSSEDPDATTFQVEDDTRSDWYTVFAFELEAEEDGGDIELNTIPVDFEVSTGEDVDDVINDAMLVIDGEEFDDFDFTNANDEFGSTTFDIDGDFVIDAGDTVTVEVMLEFKAANGTNYDSGDTIQASVTGANIDGEGADDVAGSGNVTGETHTLSTTGLNSSLDSKSANTTSVDGADNDYATFTIEVDVEAFEEDAFISRTGTVAYTYQIENASTGAVVGNATATTTVVSSSADIDGNFYRVDEGTSESFTFTVTFDPLAADEGQSYRMQLLTIEFNDTAAAPDQSWTAAPASTYETPPTFISD